MQHGPKKKKKDSSNCTLKVDVFRRERGACTKEARGPQRFDVFVGRGEGVSQKDLKILGDRIPSGGFRCVSVKYL